MRVLALDLGTRTGWAYRDKADALCSSGYADFKNGRFEGGGMRFLNFRRWLENNWTSPKPDVVYLEEVANHKGIAAAHVYGGLLAILTTWCEEHAIPYQGIPVGTIKKHLTGKGNAKKDKMIAAIQEKGYNFVVDDNEADAIAILICCDCYPYLLSRRRADFRPASVRSENQHSIQPADFLTTRVDDATRSESEIPTDASSVCSSIVKSDAARCGTSANAATERPLHSLRDDRYQF